VYLTVLHPWIMTWGATAEEQRMALPGDEADPSAYFTRAITIHAPAAEVWLWLLQIGQDRAGFYSNTWLENLFFGDIHNGAEIRPEWQERAVGDRPPMAGAVGRGLLGDVSKLRIRALDPERMITDLPGRFVLQPIDDHSTRLLLREPLGAAERSGIFGLVWDPMHFVMEQRMLRGINERAEGSPLTPPALAGVARIGWALAGLVLLGLYLSRRRWWPWLAVPLAIAVPSLIVANDPDAALAGFLAIGIAVLGALAFGRRWWAPFSMITAGVFLVLLMAPDAYVAFGALFLLIIAVAVAGALTRRLRRQPPIGRRHVIQASA
jgi:hypothetical protein